MSVYLHDIPLKQALAAIDDVLKSADLHTTLPPETIPLDEHAIGRILAAPIWAKISSPHYHASAMDGFAVRASDTAGASLTNPIDLTYGEQAKYVDTGDPLPEWANCVVMIENTEPLDDRRQTTDPSSSSGHAGRKPAHIRIREALPPWKNVRPMGEDMVATQLVLPAGHTLRPVDLGAIAGCGHHEISVVRRPRVAILPTGSELKPIGEPVQSGDIIEYNSLVMAAQINEWGGIATRFPITPDRFEAIQAAVAEAAKVHDLILLNAGSSAGSEDFSASVVNSLGEVIFHGVAVRPGHPVIFGMIKIEGKGERGKGKAKGDVRQSSIVNRQLPIFGVPGYPVSAALTGEIFVKPLIERWLGKSAESAETIEATLTRKMASPSGDDDYVRVAVGQVGERTLAAPLTRGAGVISSLVRADGLVIVPSGSQGLDAGALVTVNLLRSRDEIANTILTIGSHDMTLDLMAQFLSGENRRLASANVGSLGGLIALRRGEAHLAGSHLLDPETGEYNHSYVKRYLPDTLVQVVGLVLREQGLIVAKGNAKKIVGLADLMREDVQFVNRQRGAGTRVLLDYQLGWGGISAEAIQGYEQEEYTHLAVAAAVASGRADAGLGIAAAATALDLDFIPLFSERYDLIIPIQHAKSGLLAPLLATLHKDSFRQAVNALPGYDTSIMGKLTPN